MTAPFQRISFEWVVGDLLRRVGILEAVPAETEPFALYEIKLTTDDDTFTAGTPFKFPIPVELDGWFLTRATLAVSTVATSGSTALQLLNDTQGINMFTSALGITVGSFCSTTQKVNQTNNKVLTCDQLWCNVTSAGVNAKGLSLQLRFGPENVLV